MAGIILKSDLVPVGTAIIPASLSEEFLPLLAMVGLNVRNQRILGRVLLFISEVEQQIKT